MTDSLIFRRRLVLQAVWSEASAEFDATPTGRPLIGNRCQFEVGWTGETELAL